MPLEPIGEALESVTYIAQAWAFVLKPTYRQAALDRLRSAGGWERVWLVFEGGMAALVGFGLPAFVIWLVTTS